MSDQLKKNLNDADKEKNSSSNNAFSLENSEPNIIYFERVFNLLRYALSFLSASFYIFGNIIFANVTTFGFVYLPKNIILSTLIFNEHVVVIYLYIYW